MEVVLENIRCFQGVHRIPIRPITLMVGENSTGKTTVLATIARATDLRNYLGFSFFNEPPYELGSYDTISSRKNGNGGQSKRFGLGFVFEPLHGNADLGDVNLGAIFEAKHGQPHPVTCGIWNDKIKLEIARGKKRLEFSTSIVNRKTGQRIEGFISGSAVRIHVGKGGAKTTVRDLADDEIRDGFPWQSFFEDAGRDLKTYGNIDEIGIEADELLGLLMNLYPKGVKFNTIPLAPIRTQPQRTYSLFRDDASSEGEDVPFVLAKYFESQSDRKRGSKLRKAIRDFGVSTGLYDRIEVKRLGKTPGDPMQLQVVFRGSAYNLRDVGYGVSQALPIVVHSFLAPDNAMILVEEPEAHLHPKAQAALGSFFVNMQSKARKKFIVETHSIFLVDRVRYEVAQKHIDPASVIILYFEKKGVKTTVHPIEVDELGNLVNAPASYGSFFLEEDLRMLSR